MSGWQLVWFHVVIFATAFAALFVCIAIRNMCVLFVRPELAKWVANIRISGNRQGGDSALVGIPFAPHETDNSEELQASANALPSLSEKDAARKQDSMSTQNTFQIAVEHFRNGEFDEAASAAVLALAEDPNNGRAWELRGLVHFILGDHCAACAALEVATSLARLSPEAQYALAVCYIERQRHELATMMLAHLADSSNVPTKLLPNLTAMLGRIGDHHRAMKLCREAACRLPDAPEPWFGMAHHMGRLNYPLETIAAAVAKAFQLAPQRLHYRVTFALLSFRMRHAAEAYDLLRELTTDDLTTIRCPRALCQILKVYEFSGDFGQAEAVRNRLQRL